MTAPPCVLLQSDATVAETSLIQGRVARDGQVRLEGTLHKEAAATLMDTATKMFMNGATLDVIIVAETTTSRIK